jgi:hypothetical protein
LNGSSQPQLIQVLGRDEDDYGNCFEFRARSTVRGRGSLVLGQKHLVHITPAPILARLK